MKPNVIPYLFLLFCTFSVQKTSAQLLYSNTTFSGFVENPGFVGAEPTIILDDVQLDPAGLPEYDSIDVSMLKFGIARFVGAPAVTIKIYYTTASDTSTSFKTSPATPPVYIGSADLPAAVSQSVVTISIGDGINTLFAIPKKVGIPYVNNQAFFVGLSFSDADANNGWATASPSATNDNRYWTYNEARSTSPIDSGWFANSPAATFDLEVYGSTRLLPVHFLNFSGRIENNMALLNWSTANEINNKGFNVQRSNDGSNFETIAFIESKNSNGGQNDYSYADARFKQGSNYYRLQQVDKDGKTSYSGIIDIKSVSQLIWKIFPNPVINKGWLQLQLPKRLNVAIQVLTQSGQIVQAVNKGILNEGSYSIPLNVSNLPAGIYLVKLFAGDETYTQKIIK